MTKKLLTTLLILLHCALFTAQKILRQDLEKENTEIEDVIKKHQSFQGNIDDIKNDLQYLNNPKNSIDLILYNALLANGIAAVNDAENKESDYYYLKSIEISKEQNHQPLIVWTGLNYISYLYHYRNYNKLLPQLLYTVRIADQIQDKDILMPEDYYKKMGWIMQTFGHNKRAIEHLEKAAKLTKPNSSEYAAITDAIGLSYLYQEDYKNAEAKFNKVLTISQELKDYKRLARVLGNLSQIYEKKGNYDKAEGFLLLDIDYSKKSEDHQNTMYASILLSRLYLKKNNISKARLHIAEAEKIALSKKYFRSSELEILKTKLLISEKTNHTQEELQIRRRISTLEDSLTLSDGATNIKKAQWQIMEDEFATKLEKKQENVKQQELIENILISLVCIATVAAVFIYRKYKKESRIKRKSRFKTNIKV